MSEILGNNEFIRAEALALHADRILEQPDNIQLVQRYATKLDENFSLEVRTGGRVGFEDGFLQDSRYVYLSNCGSDNHGMAFSLNINSLQAGQELNGQTQDFYYLAEVMPAAWAVGEAEGRLMSSLLELMKRYDRENVVDQNAASEIERAYIELVSRGTTVTFRQRSFTNPDKSTVHLANNVVEGPDEYAWPHELEKPRVKISYRTMDSDNHLVFEKGRTGLLETFTEVASPFERIAAIVDESQVTRDANGKVVAVSGTFFDVLSVVEAERAAGVRELDGAQLEILERQVLKLS